MYFHPDKFIQIEQYSEQHSSSEPQLLKELYRRTWQRNIHPRMLSGAYQGRLLSLISKMIAPKRILEIGTFTGYSALCLAEGLKPTGELITIDKNEELEEFAQEFFDKSPYKHQITMLIGDAREIIPTLDLNFDLILIDADKSSYIKYFELLIDHLPSGAVILSDNVLWSGKVVEPLNPKDTDTAVLLRYNEILSSDPRIETVLLPIRDGISISRKI